MSFRQFIRKGTPPPNAAGDFLCDAREDRALPTIESWADLRTYLESCGAGADGYNGARVVWRQFLSARRRAAVGRPGVKRRPGGQDPDRVTARRRRLSPGGQARR